MAINIPTSVAVSAFCKLIEANRNIRTTDDDGHQYILDFIAGDGADNHFMTFIIDRRPWRKPKCIKFDASSAYALAEMVAKTIIYDTESTAEIKNCFTLMQMKKGVPPKPENGEIDWTSHTEPMAEIWSGLKDGKPWIAFGVLGWPMVRFELRPLE